MDALNLLITPFTVAVGISLGIVWERLKKEPYVPNEPKTISHQPIQYLARRKRGMGGIRND